MELAKKQKRRKRSVSAYFRHLFKENPSLLFTPNNEEVKRRWLADHPRSSEMPRRVAQAMANVKSQMRKAKQKGDRGASLYTGNARPGSRSLEILEEAIDECLAMAKHYDREGLEGVIKLLRQARNEIVLKRGR